MPVGSPLARSMAFKAARGTSRVDPCSVGTATSGDGGVVRFGDVGVGEFEVGLCGLWGEPDTAWKISRATNPAATRG